MKTNLRRICLILCLAILVTLIPACDSGKTNDSGNETTSPSESSAPSSESESITETETETETEKETETEIVEDVICFADYTRSKRTYLDLKTQGDIAVSFTIPAGEVKEIYLNLSDIGSFTECSFDVNLYNFNGKYDEAVNSDPVYFTYIDSTLRTYKLTLDEGTVPAGQYLLVVSFADLDPESTEEIHSKVIVDNCWLPKTFPEEYTQYSFKSYINGSPNKKTALCGGFLIEHPVVVEENDTEIPEDTTPEKYPDNVAKVILLGGQSNATGASSYSHLNNKVGSEKYQEYLDGYSNVKIFYTSGTSSGGFKYPNVSYDFVDVRAGQGYQPYNFGPELGLAEYLNANFPEETFYIIKYAIGGTGLLAHWNPLDDTHAICLDGFMEKVNEGLSILEDDGLDPRIIAFLWMQGESDASTVKQAYSYYDYQKALVELIRDEYAFFAPEKGIAFIDAAISDSGFWASWYLVNERKRQFSMESPLNYFIDTTAYGLSTLEENNDLAHYDSMSMILLGQLFGEELAKVLE